MRRQHLDLQEVWDFVQRHQEEVAERMKAREDKRRRDYRCQIGDLVLVSHKLHPLLRSSRKQAERFYGPYLVHELRGPNAVVLKGMPSRVPEVVNVTFIKPYRSSPERFEGRPKDAEPLPTVVPDEEPEWEIEAIEDTRISQSGRRKFLIKWVGYPRRDWVDLSEMENAATMVIEYFTQQGRSVPEDVQDFYLQVHYQQTQIDDDTDAD